MNKIFIFTDTTSDYPIELLNKEKDCEILQFSLTIGEDVYDQNSNPFISNKDFYARMKGGEKANTAMLNQYYFEERLTDVLQRGYNVLYLCFSSALSGSYALADKVAKDFSAKFPKNNIKVVNSAAASLGEGLFLYYLFKKRAEGVKFEELVNYAESIRNNVCHYFTVNDLQHLASLGRVSKTQAFIGTLAKVMPVLYVNTLGELVPIEKVVSRKKALKALVDKMEDKMFPADQQDVIFIGHGESKEDAEYVKSLVQERFGITNFVIDYIGPVIGCHSGYGTIALFFLGKDKIEPKDGHVSKKA